MKIFKTAVFTLFLLAHAAIGQELPRIIDHASQHPSGDTACSFDMSIFSRDTKALPIGVFDSGVGGLTVLDALLRIDAFDNNNLQPRQDGMRDFADERFVYFGDQANMPYGNYPAAGKTELLRELILRDAIFLLRKEPNKPPVKAIVIACNTATAFGLEDIRAALKVWKIDLPVVGVVEAGARGLTEMLPSDSTSDAVGILATVGTCACEAYPKAISRSTGMAGKPKPVLMQQGCVGLAGAIEGDSAFVSPDGKRTTAYLGPNPDAAMRALCELAGDELTTVDEHIRYEVASLVESHRKSGNSTPIGYVVLGCTHFPLVKTQIATAFERLRTHRDASGAQPSAALIREKLTFINPAEFTAKELFRELARKRLRLKPGEKSMAERDRFFMSTPNRDWPGIQLTPAGVLEQSYKHGRGVGEFTRNDTPATQMLPSLLPGTTTTAIEQLLPEVWQKLNAPAR